MKLGEKVWELPYGIDHYSTNDRYYATKSGKIYYGFESKEVKEVETYLKKGRRYVNIYDNDYLLAEVLLHIKVGKIDLPIDCIDWKNPTMDDVKYDLSNTDVIKSEDNNSVYIKDVEFKQIPDFSRYYISNTGIVYSEYFNRFSIHHLNDRSYHMVNLLNNENKGKTIFIHKLVYLTWIGNIPKNMEIDHLYSKSMNGVNDIELVTPEENRRRAYEAGCYNGKWYDYIIEVSEMLQNGLKTKDIANHIGFDEEHADYENFSRFVRCIRSGESYPDISKNYVFPPKEEVNLIHPIELAHKICKCIQDEPNTILKDIAERYEVSKTYVIKLKNGKIHSDISSNYDFSKRAAHHEDDEVHEMCQYMVDHPEKSLYEIGDEFGVSERYLRDIKNGLRRTDISRHYNFDIRKTTKSDQEKEKVRKICKMLSDGCLYKEIVEECGVSKSFVSNIKNKKIYADVSKDFNF